MAKYKVGDKVRIVSERPDSKNYVDEMVRFLGKEITISMVDEFRGIPYYYSEDAKPKNPMQECFCKLFGVPGYFFMDEWIAGLAEQKKPADENFSVAIRFCGRITVAELYKNGRVVKVENARCNPKDKYSMAEGARIAVSRLFEKKQEDVEETVNPAKKWKTGDKAVVVRQNGMPYHLYRIPTVVEVSLVDLRDNTCLCRSFEHTQWVRMDCLEPYKEKAK